MSPNGKVSVVQLMGVKTMPIRVGAILAALALLACESAACATDAEPVEYGKVRIAVAEPPARFSGAWPSSSAALESWFEDADALPVNHALDGLLAGDAGLFERLRIASLAVPDRDRSRWVKQLQSLLEFRTVHEGFCANARPAMEGAPSVVRDVVAPSFVEGCLLPGDRPLVLRADTPVNAVIDYFAPTYSSDGTPAPEWDDRFETAVRAEFSAAGNAYAKRRAAAALTRHPDPRAEALLLALYREAPEGDDKIQLGMLLRRGKTAEARAIGNSICAEHPDSQPCQAERASRELTARLREAGLEVFSDDEVPPPAEPAEPADAPNEVQAMAERLIGVGFDRVRGLDVAQLRMADALAILAEAGYLHGFDVETGVFPNAHDSLMRELAVLAGDPFAGALFEEIPPVFDEGSGDEGDEEIGPYRLSVYLDGKRYRIDAKNYGDWYDLEAVLTLMNTILSDRQSSFRLFPLDTGDQTAIIIAAPPDVFRKAVAADLFEAAAPDDARDAGKAYEDEVLGRSE
jgi:hypothetical protein